MENKMEVFKNEEFGEVRIIVIDNEPWFVAADVCTALELSNPTVATGRLDDDERAKFNLGRQGETTIINEPGLYSLVLGSRKPEAKGFKRWITHEVIPSIRKHGGYIVGQETMSNEEFLAKAVLMAQSVIAEKEAKLQEVKLEVEQERERNTLLTKTNHALTKETNTWDNRKLLNALVRSYSHVCCHGQFGIAWSVFYKTLLYKKGISVNSRVTATGRKIDTLSDKELKDAVQVAVTMCLENQVQIDDLLCHVSENN